VEVRGCASPHSLAHLLPYNPRQPHRAIGKRAVMKLFSKYGTHTCCFYCDSRRKKIRHTHVACGGWSLWLHAPKGLERCLLSSVELVESAHDLEDMLAAGLEESLLLVVELELDDLLDTVLAEDNGNTEVAIVDAVLAFELAADGEYALLVLDDSLDHLSCGCAWSVPCGGAHELDELVSLSMRSVTGMPATVVKRGSGTMVSP